MLKVGATVPDFQILDVDGEITSLDHILSRGAALLVAFKVSCPTCQLTLPFLERLYAERVNIVGISQDNAKTTVDFAKRLNLQFPMLVDPAGQGYPVSTALELTSVPSLFWVEKDHSITWTSVGFVRKELEDLGHQLHIAVFRSTDKVPEAKAG
jgi:peroxiredoxin